MVKKEKAEQKPVLIENVEKGVTSPKIDLTQQQRRAIDIINSPSFQKAADAANAHINPSNEAEQKPVTWDEIMKERRKELVKEKTDAEKMQRYHALTDVFNAFGKMGGSVAGGAIGGDALVGTSTKEYQPNRGYLDAIEKAKTANDRIRALDDTAFQLQANKQLRDEQWAREDKKIAEQREYETQVRQIEMNFQTERDRLQREWAVADIERRAQIEKDMLALQQKYQKELYDIRYENNGSGSGTRSGSGSGSKIKPITVNGKEYPIDMSNGVLISEIYNMIPTGLFGGSRPYGKAQYWDGEIIGRDNPTLDEMILAIGENKNNPDFIKAFENRFGNGSNNTLAGELEADVEANG